MPRNFILSITIVLIIGALSFVFLRDKEIFSELTYLNLANLFSSSDAPSDPAQVASGDDQSPGYAISLPEGFNKTSNNEDGIFIDTYEKNDKEGFQVFIMPFDEEGPLTPERVLIDLDITLEKPEYVSIGGIEALGFNSKGELVGDTYEVWAVQNGRLFQITTYATYRTQLLGILGSWKFQ